jgi:uncharacterized protein YbjT (DUF2867 family)
MILVTGASGNVGRELASLLSAKAIPMRVVSRQERKLADLPASMERIVGDLRDPELVRRAVASTTAIFLLPLFGEADQALIDEAARAATERIVMISSVAPDDTIIGRMHRDTEDWLRASGLRWTILRAGAFMSNALDWIPSIRTKSMVATPIADALLAPISPADVAKAASVALTMPGHDRRIYELTGAALLSTREKVRILAEVLGRPLDCVEISIAAMADGMTQHGAPSWLVDAVRQQMSRIRAGRAALRTDQFEALTGTPPTTFESWCLANRDRFLS